MNKLYTEDSIQSLDPREFTRLRPGVYCGSTEYSTQLLIEIISNAIDEYSGNPLADAVLAGNDVLITTDPNVSIQPLVEAVQSGTISLNQIDQSLIRIFEIKKRTGILEKNQ